MRGFLRDAIPPLSRFVVLRNAVTVTEIDEACASYVEGQKLLYKTEESAPSSVPFSDGPHVVMQSEIKNNLTSSAIRCVN